PPVVINTPEPSSTDEAFEVLEEDETPSPEPPVVVFEQPVVPELVSPLQTTEWSGDTTSDSGPDSTDLVEVEHLFGQAEQSRRAKKLLKAISLYGMVLQQFPGHRLAHLRRGQLFLFGGQAQLAVGDFTAALQGHEPDAETLLHRGDAFAVMGQL